MSSEKKTVSGGGHPLYEQVTTERLQKLSDEFDTFVQSRHEDGAEEYGEFAFLKNDMIKFMAEELADICNYARYAYMKLRIWEATIDGASIDLTSESSGVQRENELPFGATAFTPSSEVQ